MNCILKHIVEEKVEVKIDIREGEEEEVRSYWMKLRK
jgi:hypothetical protein